MDGGRFVQVTAAMDAIIRRIERHRKEKVTLVYIDTPTHPCVVPALCKTQADRYFKDAPLFQKLCQMLGVLKPNIHIPIREMKNRLICDQLSVFQGPNYAIAKLMQRMRAMKHYLGGGKVSMSVGPAAATYSVLHSSSAAIAMKYLHKFAPNRCFLVETVKPLLFMFLVYDIKNLKSKANSCKNSTPTDFFGSVIENAWHGGTWSSAYSLRSTGNVIAAYYLIERYGKFGLIALFTAGIIGAMTLVRKR